MHDFAGPGTYQQFKQVRGATEGRERECRGARVRIAGGYGVQSGRAEGGRQGGEWGRRGEGNEAKRGTSGRW